MSKTVVTPTPDTKEQIISVAERLFADRGFTATTLRNVVELSSSRSKEKDHTSPNSTLSAFYPPCTITIASATSILHKEEGWGGK